MYESVSSQQGDARVFRSVPGAFAAYAHAARAAGLAVIPTKATDAKSPVVHWGRIRRSPRASTVSRWIGRFPSSNLAYLPGVCGFAVLDLDDLRDEDRARELLGVRETPVLIVTGGRGLHIPFRVLSPIPSLDLRRWGIAGEIKCAGSIVVAPGSIHPKTGRTYRFQDGDWTAFNNAPFLETDRLAQRGLSHRITSTVQPQASRNPEGFRNTATFDFLRELIGQGTILSEGEAIEHALQFNRTQNEPAEAEAKVIATAKSVWKYWCDGKLMSRASAPFALLLKSEASALQLLDSERYNYADALTLLLHLKNEHGARDKRGQSFAIAASAMARVRSIPAWSDRKRYMKATAALKAAQIITCVAHLQRGRRAAQYRFTETLRTERAK